MPEWAKWIDFVLSSLGNIAVIVTVASVWLAVKAFKKSVEDTNQQNKTVLMSNSIELMRIFSDVIIPQIGDYRTCFDEEYRKGIEDVIKASKSQNPAFKRDMIPKELDDLIRQVAQFRAGIPTILNKLEQACAYIKCDLVIDDLVYPPLHSVFLRFVEENQDALEKITSPDVPYGNIHYAVRQWSKREGKDKLDRQQRELDRRRRALG